MKLVKNCFYNWTATDNEGEFVHSGQYIDTQDGSILLGTDHGIIGIPEGDGVFVKIGKPKNATKISIVAPKKRTKSKSVTSTKKSPTGKVKQVVELLSHRQNLTRKDAIQAIVDAGISTPAGASTFWNSSKKYLNL